MNCVRCIGCWECVCWGSDAETHLGLCMASSGYPQLARPNTCFINRPLETALAQNSNAFRCVQTTIMNKGTCWNGSFLLFHGHLEVLRAGSVSTQGSVFKAAYGDFAARRPLPLMGVKRVNPHAPLWKFTTKPLDFSLHTLIVTVIHG